MLWGKYGRIERELSKEYIGVGVRGMIRRRFLGKFPSKKSDNIKKAGHPRRSSDETEQISDSGGHNGNFTPDFSLHSEEFAREFRKRHGHHGANHSNPEASAGKFRSGNLVIDLTRLGAALFTAGIFGFLIFKPLAGPTAVKSIAANNPLALTSLAERPCRSAEAVVTSDFTNFENVLSISPLGGVTAPGEILPVPYIRINTRNDGTPFQRMATPVKAPANADIIAIERRLVRDGQGEGATKRASWTVHFKPCDAIHIAYDRLDEIDADLIERAGGLSAFSEIGGPDHLAKEVSLRVASGAIIGNADGFDVALHDDNAEYQDMARPERYRKNPYAKAELFNVAPSLIKTITPDHSRARCALDYLRTEDHDAWSAKLGDAWGIRRAKGDDACRTALIDLKGTAQGAWYTDAAHNGAATKISAIALAPDTINPDRMVFALHGRLASLTEDMVGAPSFAAISGKESVNIASLNTGPDEFITFEKGTGRVNRAFDEIRDGGIYCYERMRVNFIGPRINGVFLLQKISETNVAGRQISDMLKIEARDDIMSCGDVDSDVTLSEAATGFFR